jgi:hypothetical protein
MVGDQVHALNLSFLAPATIFDCKTIPIFVCRDSVQGRLSMFEGGYERGKVQFGECSCSTLGTVFDRHSPPKRLCWLGEGYVHNYYAVCMRAAQRPSPGQDLGRSGQVWAEADPGWSPQFEPFWGEWPYPSFIPPYIEAC